MKISNIKKRSLVCLETLAEWKLCYRQLFPEDLVLNIGTLLPNAKNKQANLNHKYNKYNNFVGKKLEGNSYASFNDKPRTGTPFFTYVCIENMKALIKMCTFGCSYPLVADVYISRYVL